MPAPFSTPIPYPRPARLSDPGHDFTPEECAAILAVPDDRLGWPELGEIFQSYLPAGDYAECAYFIPRALRFLDERARDILREGVRRDPSLAACWAKWFRGSSWTLDKPEEHPHPATT